MVSCVVVQYVQYNLVVVTLLLEKIFETSKILLGDDYLSDHLCGGFVLDDPDTVNDSELNYSTDKDTVHSTD